MTFRPDEVQNFLAVFDANKAYIAGSEGCISLRLMREKDKQNVFFTISEWTSEEFLNKYRNSELFESVWGRTKLMFAEKPEAWTVV